MGTTARERRVQAEQQSERSSIRREVWEALESADGDRQLKVGHHLQLEAAATAVGVDLLKEWLPEWMLEELTVDLAESAKTRALQIEGAIELYCVDEDSDGALSAL